MTREEFLAGRIAAGRVINIETCKIFKNAVNVADPYGIYGDEVPHCIGRLLFVASNDSDGIVFIGDLPDDKVHALHARIDRATQKPTTPEGISDALIDEYNCAVSALDDVIYGFVDVANVGERFPGIPLDVIQDGARLALAKLSKEGTPFQEALKRKFRAIEDRRTQS